MNDLGQDLRSPLIQIKLASWLRGQGQRGWAPTSTKRMPPTAAAGTATRTTVEVWLAARTQVRSGNKVSAAVYRGRKKRPQPIGGRWGEAGAVRVCRYGGSATSDLSINRSISTHDSGLPIHESERPISAARRVPAPDGGAVRGQR
jgi:hypothetical protein